MSEIKNVPKLRFNEFTGEWKKVKGINSFQILSGGSFKSEDSVNNGCKWLKIVNVGINKLENDNISYLPCDFKIKYSKYILKENDLILALTRPILNHELKICFVDKYFNDSLLNQRVCKISSINNNVRFIYYLLQLNKSIYYLESTIMGSDPPNLSLNDLYNINLSFPINIDEQNKIANFLGVIDKKIELLEKKLSLYQSLKKFFISGLFTQKLRFKEFNNNWDSFYLKDLFSSLKGKGLSKDKIGDGDKDCILYGELYTTYDEIITNVKNKTKFNEGILSRKGDILIPSSTTTKGIDLATASTILKDDVLLGGDITILRKKKDNLNEIFFAYYLSHAKTRDIVRLTQGSTIIHLYWVHLKNINVYLPSIEEQNKIVEFLSFFDKEIKLLKKQIYEIQDFKKSMLQQMFV